MADNTVVFPRYDVWIVVGLILLLDFRLRCEKMSSERNIGVALDYSASSKYALKWVVDNQVREGDQLIVIVVNKDYSPDDGQYQLFGKYGSRKHVNPLSIAWESF